MGAKMQGMQNNIRCVSIRLSLNYSKTYVKVKKCILIVTAQQQPQPQQQNNHNCSWVETK